MWHVAWARCRRRCGCPVLHAVHPSLGPCHVWPSPAGDLTLPGLPAAASGLLCPCADLRPGQALPRAQLGLPVWPPSGPRGCPGTLRCQPVSHMTLAPSPTLSKYVLGNEGLSGTKATKGSSRPRQRECRAPRQRGCPAERAGRGGVVGVGAEGAGRVCRGLRLMETPGGDVPPGRRPPEGALDLCPRAEGVASRRRGRASGRCCVGREPAPGPCAEGVMTDAPGTPGSRRCPGLVPGQAPGGGRPVPLGRPPSPPTPDPLPALPLRPAALPRSSAAVVGGGGACPPGAPGALPAAAGSAVSGLFPSEGAVDAEACPAGTPATWTQARKGPAPQATAERPSVP